MKTYTFKVVVEPDEGGYHAYCPALRHHGAVTQGGTPQEALKNINEVVQMIVDELLQDHVPLAGCLLSCLWGRMASCGADAIGPPCVGARAKDVILPHKPRQQWNGYLLTIPKAE